MKQRTSAGASAQDAYFTQPTSHDPYRYQQGFGNRFASEAIPGVLPQARNAPQKVKYDLYSEQLNGSAFVAPRASIQNVWMYRIRPSVAHGGIQVDESLSTKIRSCFLPVNENVAYTASEQAWDPFPFPDNSQSINFVEGIQTIGGNGDPTLKDGLAVHIYSANTSMHHTAFCSNDGDMLILPQTGRLDVQTELGRMIVRPGELAVIQAGIRFKVSLPDGPSRGYIQEVFGTHWELPELGPFGSNGMAYPRDFETPVAAFDIDASDWTVHYKIAARVHTCHQKHTPFDVVAWHGNYAPYKYGIEKFVNMACVEKEQADPTIYCVLRAPSKTPGISISEFLAFTPRWSTTTNTFRPPYYHRNMSTEVMGVIYGQWRAPLQAGGLTYECSFMPHGESYATWKAATTEELQPTRIMEGTMAFMMHMSVPFLLTRHALHGTGCLQPQDDGKWDDLQAHFLDHLEDIDRVLVAAGRQPLESSESGPPQTNCQHSE
ncbi:homogentisate 1,2-dioxygenase [Teratosphaeria destructans]|uniref:homogentisate 1,2-dioxygenase n=1 Tax=Teratosphaeria destructans TaxID=418781 RepID=A0A9W7SVF6_9PEZI|nr:homogentisate 1,2-dioxygenase [Teratosphaeria destructans]